jgi:hypothetical protein
VPLRVALSLPNLPLDAACIPRPSTASFGSTTPFTSPRPPTHPPCPGLRGGCPICSRAVRTACRSQHYWHRLTAALGLCLSDDKRQLPSQRVTYTGMVVDSFLGAIQVSIPPDKKARLAECLEEFFFRRKATLSELAYLHGRIQHC